MAGHLGRRKHWRSKQERRSMSSRPAILNGGRENQGKQANGDSFQGIMQKFFKTVSAEDRYRYDVTSCEHWSCQLWAVQLWAVQLCAIKLCDKHCNTKLFQDSEALLIRNQKRHTISLSNISENVGSLEPSLLTSAHQNKIVVSLKSYGKHTVTVHNNWSQYHE